MRWLGRACWHIAEWATALADWLHMNCCNLSGWQELESAALAADRHHFNTVLRCMDLDNVLERTKRQ